MASFTAELRVAGRVYSLRRCDYQSSQNLGQRGRVNSGVRHHPIDLLLDVPRDNFLAAWAANDYKQCAADIVYCDATSGQALETLSMAGAYCVLYNQSFRSGDTTTGSYVVHIRLTDPAGFT